MHNRWFIQHDHIDVVFFLKKIKQFQIIMHRCNLMEKIVSKLQIKLDECVFFLFVFVCVNTISDRRLDWTFQRGFLLQFICIVVAFKRSFFFSFLNNYKKLTNRRKKNAKSVFNLIDFYTCITHIECIDALKR